MSREDRLQPTPLQNHLLAALPPDDYERLRADLRPVPLPRGHTIHVAGEREEFLHFLTAGVVSRIHVTQRGASAEFAVTGREGVIGIASFLGGECAPGRALVLSDGFAYRIAAGALQAQLEREAALRQSLLRYTQALIAQAGQIAVCNRHHSLEQRLCRWMLSVLDRLPATELTITHELIADILGVRREGVTEALGRLQRSELVHCSRGCIAVLDRARLEARACECHGVIRREYRRLLGAPQSIADNAGMHGNFRPVPHGFASSAPTLN